MSPPGLPTEGLHCKVSPVSGEEAGLDNIICHKKTADIAPLTVMASLSDLTNICPGPGPG